MDYQPGERQAIELVKSLGASYGYGNLISRLKDAWSEHLRASPTGPHGDVCDVASGHICVWCYTDTRTGKHRPDLDPKTRDEQKGGE